MTERVCYRYRTGTLIGPWRRTAAQAHQDAIEAGQIYQNSDGTEWRVEGQIEPSYCDHAGPCGGNYPAG